MLRRSLKRAKIWTKINLPLAAKALVHGQFFIRDITSRALTVGHGLGKKEQFRSGKEGVMQRRLQRQKRMQSRLGLKAIFITTVRNTGGIP